MLVVLNTGHVTPLDARDPITGTCYKFVEQCRLDNGIIKCSCTAYDPTSLLTDTTVALTSAYVPAHVAGQRTDEVLHSSEWDYDFSAEDMFEILFQEGDHPAHMSDSVGATVDHVPQGVAVGCPAQLCAVAFMMVEAIA